MNLLSPPKLWTVWLDYFATGEGRTIMATVGYAHSEEEAREQFSEKFGSWFAQGAEAAQGVVRNDFTNYLFSPTALDIFTRNEGRVNVVAFASIHINAS